MWGDHLLASLRSPHHISAPVRTGLAFLFLHLPRNDTISRMLWMIHRHIFLYRRVCCECSFCQHHSGFCNYSTDRLKSWISVNAMSYIHFFKRKLKERKLLCKLRCLRRISRPEKSLVEIFSDYGRLKSSYFEGYVYSRFGDGISRGWERKSTNWKI